MGILFIFRQPIFMQRDRMKCMGVIGLLLLLKEIIRRPYIYILAGIIIIWIIFIVIRGIIFVRFLIDF